MGLRMVKGTLWTALERIEDRRRTRKGRRLPLPVIMQ